MSVRGYYMLMKDHAVFLKIARLLRCKDFGPTLLLCIHILLLTGKTCRIPLPPPHPTPLLTVALCVCVCVVCVCVCVCEYGLTHCLCVCVCCVCFCVVYLAQESSAQNVGRRVVDFQHLLNKQGKLGSFYKSVYQREGMGKDHTQEWEKTTRTHARTQAHAHAHTPVQTCSLLDTRLIFHSCTDTGRETNLAKVADERAACFQGRSFSPQQVTLMIFQLLH